jgi:hypothetical protein
VRDESHYCGLLGAKRKECGVAVEPVGLGEHHFFNSNGSFSNALTVTPGTPQRFYRLQTQ